MELSSMIVAEMEPETPEMAVFVFDGYAKGFRTRELDQGRSARRTDPGGGVQSCQFNRSGACQAP